ncbi:MAG: peptidoglycan editing factor PgeF [Burkholderiales bacterium]|nr:peptidoglycan editing factor PgeF [Burkholderiales bacterium]
MSANNVLPGFIRPVWSAPACVQAAITTRQGGVSRAPFDGLNLGYATADRREDVAENERITAAALGVGADALRWVYQVHGAGVQAAESLPSNTPLGATGIEGDAIVCRTAGMVCGIKVADCMPVLFADDDGCCVGAAHAGWRGMVAGVIENTLQRMAVDPARVSAWLGPCIGPAAFEVGDDVREAFVSGDAGAAQHFLARSTPGKFLCDLPAIARQRLARAGVTRVAASGACTYSDATRFFSHRRDRVTGRMAAFVWLAP